MTQHAHQMYQGCDWQTYRYSAAQVYDLLDQLREVTGVVLSGEAPAAFIAPASFAPLDLLNDLSSDLVGSLDLALADLSVAVQNHLPSRWLMVELRTLVTQLPAMVRLCADDQDVLPQIADRGERIRHLLQRLDA